VSVIEADHYRREVVALENDPIIRAMAEEMPEGLNTPDITHDDGSPNFNFMMAASHEYNARGGTQASSIGGPAKAILRVLKGEK
jgi:hypothetical protein